MTTSSPLTRRQGLAALAGAAVTLPAFAKLALADHHMTGDATMAGGDHATQTLTLGMLSKKASELAEKEASAAPVKEFAKLEIAEVKTVTEVLKANGATPPPSLPEPLQAKLDKMKDLSGRELETMYVNEQIAVHEQLLGVQEQMKGKPLTEPTSVLAHLAIDSIKSHIAMLELIKTTM